MPSVSRSRGVGQYVASEAHNVLWDRLTKPGARATLVCTGSHGNADTPLTLADGLARVQALLGGGFIVATMDQGQTASQGTFGNDTIITRVGQLRTFVQGASSPIAAAGKVNIMGGSGGATAAINYALRNPANVAALYLMNPLTDLADFYNNRTDVVVPQAEVDAAYGGHATFLAKLPTNSPIAQSLAPLAGVPVRITWATDDPYIPPATVTAFAAGIAAVGGLAETLNMGAVGHGTTGLDPYDCVRFFQAHP